MRRQLLTPLFLGIAALATPSLHAQDEKKPDPKKLPPKVLEILKLDADQLLKQFDNNKDGFLQAEEAPPFLAKAFALADKNGDAKLDRDEVGVLLRTARDFLAKGPPPLTVDAMLENLLRRFDKNKDDRISKEEAQGDKLEGAFAAFDKNKDGLLDRPELRPLAEKILAGKKDGPRGKDTPLEFDALDKDADGRLTPKELAGTPLAARFAEIDANRDGRIDPAEFDAWLRKTKPKE